jgi:xylose isomerase
MNYSTFHNSACRPTGLSLRDLSSDLIALHSVVQRKKVLLSKAVQFSLRRFAQGKFTAAIYFTLIIGIFFSTHMMNV